MSDLRVALVIEGKTDLIIIEAALKAILPRAFILTKLQPEERKPEMGEGWPGVLRWCRHSAERHPASLDTDPSLESYDILIIHLDVDVASLSYADAGLQVEAMAAQLGWLPLPCNQDCPPVANSVGALESVLKSWLLPATVGARTVLCLPAQASGTWLAAASLPTTHPLLAGVECNLNVENRLSQLPLGQRIRKKSREYQQHAVKVTNNWPTVKAICPQALMFETAVLLAI